MATKEEFRMVALNFTKYMLMNKLLSPGAVEEVKLLNFYSEFQISYPSCVQRSEIVDALKQACFVKKQTMLVDTKKKSTIEFKERIFQLSAGISHQLKDIMSPRIRVARVHGGSRNKFSRRLLNGFGDMWLDDDANEPLDVTFNLRQLKKLQRTNKKTFVERLPFLLVGKIHEKIVGTDRDEMHVLNIRNISETPLTVTILDAYCIENEDAVFLFHEAGLVISQGENYSLNMSVNFKSIGIKICSIVFEIATSQTADEVISLLVKPIFEVVTIDIIDLFAVDDYQAPVKNTNSLTPLPAIHGEFLHTRNVMRPKLSLNNHLIPAALKAIFDREFKIDLMLPEDEPQLNRLRELLCNKTFSKILHNQEGLNEQNYVERFKFLMWLEEYSIEKEMEMYNQLGTRLKLDSNKQLVKLQVPGLSEGRPSLMKGDRVYVRERNAKVRFEGVVHNIEEEFVFLAFNKLFRENYLHYQSLDVEFAINRSDFRLCHRALKQIEVRKMTSLLFPNENIKKPKKKDTIKIRPFFNPNIANNDEQVIAIENIVKNSAFPAPYILFGPPGTGKTATIVEAIAQIWSIYKREKKTCVCAPSNSAADLITIRLLQHKIPAQEMFRLYAMSRSDSEIPNELKKCCNYDRLTKEMYFPSKECVEFKTVIVLTPITAGRLVSGGIYGGHFDYLFMDEAGHAVEPEMIVPIIGLLTTTGDKKKPCEVKGSLILAGDPKQLGPVIQSKLAIHVGLEMSLLERLMTQSSVYQKDDATSRYNPLYITKLVNNYRSHKHILHVPNYLFYDNELESAGSENKIECALNWSGLPKRGVPLIFHGVKGREIRESNSPSYFNPFEIAVVSEYLEKLVNRPLGRHIVREEDIGVITPYKKQVCHELSLTEELFIAQKLKQHLRKPERRWHDITVASVEEFQGQERLIIIISTVRSQVGLVHHDFQFGLGFLKNAKRFNVAVTRAAALLIVIGNPDILLCDPHWRAFIDYCTKHDCCVGEPPSHSVSADFKPKERRPMDCSALMINADIFPEDRSMTVSPTYNHFHSDHRKYTVPKCEESDDTSS